MNRKAMWIAVVVGSTLGGCVPSLWHASAFSLWGVIFSALGGFVGIWIAWRWLN